MTGDALGDRSLVVVSNREPYVHDYVDGEPTVQRPTGGLVTALDGVVAETGGTWVAWGSGDADFDPDVAPDGRVEMPPDATDADGADIDGRPGYTLSRLDLPRRLVENYYYGYSNQVLWPVCHLEADPVNVDPAFADAYREANRRFAERAVEANPDVVWFQDYHLALAPRYVREQRPDARLVQFWHVPWPTPEFFEICPQATELLRGLLGNDAVGFHLERYAENFRDCVARFVPDATVTESGIGYDGRMVETYASPIGIDADRVTRNAASDAAEHYWERVAARYDLREDRSIVLGVDRLDYTKGIVERLDALSHLLETTPELAGEFTYVQKGTRTRERIPAYRRYYDEVRARIADLDRAYGTEDWTPAVYIEEDIDDRELAGLYRHADVAVVSSRRDGMNLVAKEFAAAQGRPAPTAALAPEANGAPAHDRIPGALVLSRFVGAAESLCPAALAVNPYDVAGFAATIREALAMDPGERRERAASMQTSVEETDINAWLAAQKRVLAGGERVVADD